MLSVHIVNAWFLLSLKGQGYLEPSHMCICKCVCGYEQEDVNKYTTARGTERTVGGFGCSIL